VLFFISSVRDDGEAGGGAAIRADHYDSGDCESLHAVGDRLISLWGSSAVRVFSDSLEDYASGLTPELLPEFNAAAVRSHTAASCLVGDFVRYRGYSS